MMISNGKQSVLADHSPFAWKKISSHFLHQRFKCWDSERSRCYFESMEDYFGDLLNPVDATPTQIHEEQVGEGIQITKADVNAVIKSLKTGKAPGEDDIRPEMLKAMNIYGVCWLTRVCKVACRTGQVPKQWQTSGIIPIHKKETRENALIIGAYLSSVSQERSTPNVLKEIP